MSRYLTFIFRRPRCKTVRRMLLDSGLSALRRWCIVAKRLYGSRCHLIDTDVGLGPRDSVLDGDPGHIALDGDPAPPRKGAQQPPPFSPVYCGQTVGDPPWYRGRPRPKRHCVRCEPSSAAERSTSPPPHFYGLRTQLTSV